jgi:hypothetical protein
MYGTVIAGAVDPSVSPDVSVRLPSAEGASPGMLPAKESHAKLSEPIGGYLSEVAIFLLADPSVTHELHCQNLPLGSVYSIVSMLHMRITNPLLFSEAYRNHESVSNLQCDPFLLGMLLLPYHQRRYQ